MLRHLPPSRPIWRREADVVVVGSGAAGMSAALAAASHGRHVLLLTKDALGGGSTPLAQGGLAAVVGADDSPGLHLRDTLVAGVGLCDTGPVAELVAQAPAVIASLSAKGARLRLTEPRLEGGHSRRRILHCGDDAAGAEVHRVLLEALLASPVEIIEHAVALDLLLDERGAAGGLLAGLAGPDGDLRAGTVAAPAVVLATGGFGQAFAATTNPAGVTGDGLALAARAGAELRDVEFVQFHPTVLWQAEARGRRPLITEALRGAGAVLVDAAGRRVMAGRHPLADLAPRDVVAAAMQERIEQDGGPEGCLWLDATGVGREVLENGFPSVTAACRAAGIDPVTDPIPVAPGAHYAGGGVRADLDGRTSITGLYAVGEVASTGVHGANRLASNSLTESLLAGQRAGELLGRRLPEPAVGDLRPPAAGSGVSPTGRPALAAAMSRHAGVVRDAAGLDSLLAMLAAALPTAQEPAKTSGPADTPGVSGPGPVSGPGGVFAPGVSRPGVAPERGAVSGRGAPTPPEPDLAAVEAASLHTVSTLVAVCALAREESRGSHRRRDAAATAESARHTLLRWHDGQLRVDVGDPAMVGA